MNICPVVLGVEVVLTATRDFELVAPGAPVAVPCLEGGDQELISQKVDLVQSTWSIVSIGRL
eukprot:12933112-Prorocentrum_lima.AAC.1